MKTFKYQVTKTYDHNEGLSCCFRQYKTDTHCSKLHGYAISIKMTFGSNELDSRNWAGIGFGELKEFKQWIKYMFDHTTVVDSSDPEIETFKFLEQKNIIQLRIVEKVGCESFAKMVFDKLLDFTSKNENITATLVSIEIREHSANSAIYTNPDLI